MSLQLDDKLVADISSRALFDLEKENEIYENNGLKAYSDYQLKHADDSLKPGTAFPPGIFQTRPNPNGDIEQIRIAFDGDAVIFSDVSERIYQSQGLQAFTDCEYKNSQKPLSGGPFDKLLKTLPVIQQQFGEGPVPIRTTLVTSRNAPAHE